MAPLPPSGPSVVLLNRGNNTTCTINLHGATITSWRVSNQEQLFMSQLAHFDGKQHIRGGVNFVFPQYSDWSFGMKHGFARITRWHVESAPERMPNGDVQATFCLRDNDFTRSMWNYQFCILYRVILREKELQLQIGISNPSKHLTFIFKFLLHTYIKVPDVRRCEITGLHDCIYMDKTRGDAYAKECREIVYINEWTDRIYQDTPPEHIITNAQADKKIRMHKCNLPDTVLWNPWVDMAHEMTDMADDEYMNMFCVEAGRVLSPYILLPGETFEASVVLQSCNRNSIASNAHKIKFPHQMQSFFKDKND